MNYVEDYHFTFFEPLKHFCYETKELMKSSFVTPTVTLINVTHSLPQHAKYLG